MPDGESNLTLKQALAVAYQADQVLGDRGGALAALRQWIDAHDDNRTQAVAELARLHAFIRSVRGRRADHISTVAYDLFTAALR